MMNLNHVIDKMKDENQNFIEYYDANGKKVIRYFSQVYQDMQGVLRQFDGLGLVKGDRVGIIATTGYQWVLIDLACLARGLITVPFDNAKSHDIDALLQEYALNLILTDSTGYLNGKDRVIAFERLCAHTDDTPTSQPLQTERYADDDPFTMIFTSGTTGREKGIEVRTKCFNDLMANTQRMFNFGPQDKILIFLPLHVYLERCYIYTSILLGIRVNLAPLAYLLKAITKDQPTVIVGIPYFFESMYTLFLQETESQAEMTRSLEAHSRKNSGVFQPFRDFWGGRIRYFLSGSAPCQKKILTFYHDMGIPIYEGYGMSEIAGLLTLNAPGHLKVGSVGKVFPNKEIKFDDDRQILVRGAFAANTQYYNASEEENNRTYLPDGWIATGDVGYFDEQGYLFINGRIKDIIVLSNGQKAHPASIEDRINASPRVGSSIVIGDNRPYLVALIVPKDKNLSPDSMKAEIKEINAGLPSDQQVQGYHLLSEDFTPFNGFLTSSFKLNRPFIAQQFNREIDALYEEA